MDVNNRRLRSRTDDTEQEERKKMHHQNKNEKMNVCINRDMNIRICCNCCSTKAWSSQDSVMRISFENRIWSIQNELNRNCQPWKSNEIFVLISSEIRFMIGLSSYTIYYSFVLVPFACSVAQAIEFVDVCMCFRMSRSYSLHQYKCRMLYSMFSNAISAKLITKL